MAVLALMRLLISVASWTSYVRACYQGGEKGRKEEGRERRRGRGGGGEGGGRGKGAEEGGAVKLSASVLTWQWNATIHTCIKLSDEPPR